MQVEAHPNPRARTRGFLAFSAEKKTLIQAQATDSIRALAVGSRPVVVRAR
jgi:hypothetical protein